MHTPLMRVDKAGTSALAQSIGGKPLIDRLLAETHTCYLGDREHGHAMGFWLRPVPGLPAARGGFRQMEGGVVNSRMERQRVREGVVFFALFALTIPAANWLIGHAGTACVAPHGPCVIPVAPGVMAPSGVTMVGVALVLRDLVQRRLGTRLSALAILSGGAISALLAPAPLIIASVVAFLLSEFADLAVYTPLGRRRLIAAVIASSCAGLVVDSVLFLWLAFGSLEFLLGQIIGKAWMVLLSVPFVTWLRRRDARLGIRPA